MTSASGLRFAGSSGPPAEELETPPRVEARVFFTQRFPCPEHNSAAERSAYALSEWGFDAGGVCP